MRTPEPPTLDANGDIQIRLKCLHCQSPKRLIFDPMTGALVRQVIDYVDGYLNKGVVKTLGYVPNKQEYRREFGRLLLKELPASRRRRLRLAQREEVA